METTGIGKLTGASKTFMKNLQQNVGSSRYILIWERTTHGSFLSTALIAKVAILFAICERTIVRDQSHSGTTATLFDYKQPLVKAIWALKYHHKRSLAAYFGTALYREFFKQLTHGHKKLKEEIFLIPIPAHKSKRGTGIPTTPKDRTVIVAVQRKIISSSR